MSDETNFRTSSSGSKKDYLVEFLKFAIDYLPRNVMSAGLGRLATADLPDVFCRWTVEWFARRFELDMSEAEKPLHEYANVGELFTRNLREGARPIGEGVVHPADSQLTDGGRIESDLLVQAKASTYSLAEFLGSQGDARACWGGHLLTYYLCPTDYHHVHAPMDVKIRAARVIRGDLWPVNPWSLSTHPRIFARNERIVIDMQSERGRAFLVMVGATVVGQMSVSFDAGLRGNSGGASRGHNYDPLIDVRRGERVGTFHMGSTVIMIYGPGVLPADFLAEAAKVRMGETLLG